MAPEPAEGWRLALYRRLARALNGFFERWTAPFCLRCLEVTRRHHRGDPRADVELLTGTFPGCCHAGVGDALWVRGTGGEGRFPPDLAADMAAAREALPPGPESPPEYAVRECQTGRRVRGVGCRYLGPRGCRLGDLKAPLCLAYLCEPVRDHLAGAADPGLAGDDTDDFRGAGRALRAVVTGEPGGAEAEVAALEARLAQLEARLGADPGSGEELYRRWAGMNRGVEGGDRVRQRDL